MTDFFLKMSFENEAFSLMNSDHCLGLRPIFIAWLALGACNNSTSQPNDRPAVEQAALPVIEAEWTAAAGQRAQVRVSGGKSDYALPELRVYNARGQLVHWLQKGFATNTIGPQLDAAIRDGNAIPGPSLEASLYELETGDGKPAPTQVANGKITLVDYWAEWCVPCKVLGKELRQWAAQQPAGSVQIVHAETDLMKWARAQGEKTYIVTKDANGKLQKVEVN